MGGDLPLTMPGGHNRPPVPSINVVNELMLQTHRGAPVVWVSEADAAERGVRDGDQVRVWNDVSQFQVQARVAPAIRPGQVLMYNGWEPYQCKNRKDPSNLEPGMVKYLHLAGGYGQLRYRTICWQPVQLDRGVRVDFSLSEATTR